MATTCEEESCEAREGAPVALLSVEAAEVTLYGECSFPQAPRMDVSVNNSIRGGCLVMFLRDCWELRGPRRRLNGLERWLRCWRVC